MKASRTPLTERERASFGPRALKQVGSPAWCYQAVNDLRRTYQFKKSTVEDWERILAEVVTAKAWEVIPTGKPYGSLEALLLAEVGATEEEARNTVAARAEKAEPLAAPHARPGNRNAAKCDDEQSGENAADDVSRVSHGNGADYLTRRIARDRPDVLERMKAGEFPSVRAAALEAGIVKVRWSCPSDVPGIARALSKRLTQSELAELLLMLGGASD